MAKLSISIPDELQKKTEARAQEKGVTVSHVIAEALEEYFARDASGAPQQAPAPSPPSTLEARMAALEGRVNALETKSSPSTPPSADGNADLKKRIGDLDLRLSKLWHDVHEG